jgi:uncharacterized protein (DUF488 family)
MSDLPIISTCLPEFLNNKKNQLFCTQNMSMPQTVWTIGHSNHPFDVFVEILKSLCIHRLAYIRGYPGSRKNPQFNREFLSENLPEAGIEYFHLPGLGGRRKTKPDSRNTAWRVDAFRGYADYMETDEFTMAVSALQQIAVSAPTAYMCAESMWWRCHRSLVSDYLEINGWNVKHIMGVRKSSDHHTRVPFTLADGKLIYNVADL